MKKKIILLLLCCLVMFETIGCSGKQTSTNTEDNAKLKELEKQVADLETENKGLKAEVETLKSSEDNSKEEQKKVDEKIEKEENSLQIIKKGDTIKNDGVEIKIKNVELTYDVLPKDTSSFYTHYAADSGNVYIHVETSIKNTQKQDVSCDEIMTIVADYNDGYTYNSFAVPEDTSTGFTYANITSIKPLEKLGVRYLINCPQEVEETKNPLFLTFKLGEKSYKYVIRK